MMEIGHAASETVRDDWCFAVRLEIPDEDLRYGRLKQRVRSVIISNEVTGDLNTDDRVGQHEKGFGRCQKGVVTVKHSGQAIRPRLATPQQNSCSRLYRHVPQALRPPSRRPSFTLNSKGLHQTSSSNSINQALHTTRPATLFYPGYTYRTATSRGIATIQVVVNDSPTSRPSTRTAVLSDRFILRQLHISGSGQSVSLVAQRHLCRGTLRKQQALFVVHCIVLRHCVAYLHQP
jgi:hypothetical protein